MRLVLDKAIFSLYYVSYTNNSITRHVRKKRSTCVPPSERGIHRLKDPLGVGRRKVALEQGS